MEESKLRWENDELVPEKFPRGYQNMLNALRSHADVLQLHTTHVGCLRWLNYDCAATLTSSAHEVRRIALELRDEYTWAPSTHDKETTGAYLHRTVEMLLAAVHGLTDASAELIRLWHTKHNQETNLLVESLTELVESCTEIGDILRSSKERLGIDATERRDGQEVEPLSRCCLLM